MKREHLPPHLIPLWPDAESDDIHVTFEHFGQRDLAHEQLFRAVHNALLEQAPDLYKPESYKQFWDLCTLGLGRWVEDNYGHEDLETITEEQFGELDGVGCFAYVYLDWYEHGEKVAAALNLQLDLFGDVRPLEPELN